jgi:hypothetical protein
MKERIQPGARIVVRDVIGRTLPRRALTGIQQGGSFPVVWACVEREWEVASAEGRKPDGIPWPAEDVTLAES